MRWILPISMALLVAALAPSAQAQTAADLIIRTQNTVSLINQAGYLLLAATADTDNDGLVEPLIQATPAVVVPVEPAKLSIPNNSAAPKSDGWERPFGYCPFDNGATNASAGRITGVNTAAQTSIVLGVISAGSDGVFNTTCAQLKAGTLQGDDIGVYFSQTQAALGSFGSASFWFGKPVASLASLTALAATASGSLADGEVRVTLNDYQLHAYRQATNDWTSSSGVQEDTDVRFSQVNIGNAAGTGTKGLLINGVKVIDSNRNFFGAAAAFTGTVNANAVTVTGAVTIGGQLLASAGTNTSPSISFSGDTNTGFYSAGPDQIGVAANGANVATFSSTGLVVNGTLSAVGGINSTTIGATTPATGAFTTLSASGQILAANGLIAAPSYSFTSDTDTGFYLAGANQIGVSVGNANVATFSANLLSVIGAISATTGINIVGGNGLQVNGVTVIDASKNFSGGTGAFTGAVAAGGQFLATAGAVGTPSYSFSAETGLGIYRPAAKQIGVAVNGVKVGTFSSTGLALATTVTFSNPILDLTQTWTAASASSFTGIRLNIASATNADATSKLLDLQVASASKFSVASDGTVTTASGLRVNGKTIIDSAWHGTVSDLFLIDVNTVGAACNPNKVTMSTDNTGAMLQCVGSAWVAMAPPGTLCGWRSPAGGTVTNCAGLNPNTSCPSGYTKTSLQTDLAGFAIAVSCVKN